MSHECELDEKGHCKTHAPGTQGDIDQQNRIIAAVDRDISASMLKILDTADLMNKAGQAVDNMNAKRTADGLEPARNYEDEIVHLLLPLILVGSEVVAKIRELRAVGPEGN